MSNPEKIALLTDSTADLPAPMREGKPIYVVPLKIRCEDGEYSDGVDITAEGVYERLHRGELPRTSLPEGGVVSDTLDQIRADGYERVIAVMLSSGLSGTYNMVRLQAGQRDDRSTPPRAHCTRWDRWCWRGISTTASGTASSTETRTGPLRNSPKPSSTSHV